MQASEQNKLPEALGFYNSEAEQTLIKNMLSEVTLNENTIETDMKNFADGLQKLGASAEGATNIVFDSVGAMDDEMSQVEIRQLQERLNEIMKNQEQMSAMLAGSINNKRGFTKPVPNPKTKKKKRRAANKAKKNSRKK